MNCFRCGYEYTTSECFVCGKLAPDKQNMVGADSDCLRIAVIIPDCDMLTQDVIDSLSSASDHYQLENTRKPRQHIFVYTPARASALFETMRVTEMVKDRMILFNGRRRPYDADLWLPLLWYLT